MIDLKADLVKSLSERLKVQIAELRSIGEDLKAQGEVDEVMLTRIKAVECRLETYDDILLSLVR